MDLSLILEALALKYPIIGSVLIGLGILVVVAQCVVVLTPSKSDDEKWEKIKAVPVIGALIAYVASKAPIQKK